MKHDPKWDAHEERLENMRIKCLMPTPHGRAVAPWRELVAAPTTFEQAMDQALASQPRARKGIDPRKPWIGRGDMEQVSLLELPDWDLVKLQ